jgi:acyl-CoA dehydrogenase
VTIFWLLLPIFLFLWLAYRRSLLSVWTIAFGIYLILLTAFSTASPILLSFLWVVYGLLAITLNIKPIRRHLLTAIIFNQFKKSVPRLSATEKAALAAGTVNWEGELFSGMPDWNNLLSFRSPSMTQEECDFLNGPVSELCAMIDNWEIRHHLSNIPDKIWDFLKRNGFFGMIIPKQYDGKGFSAYAHSAVLTKIAGKSMSVASVVAVPNSLGPAELLLQYGTVEQQAYYLPRLAQGLEIPCFALTGPEAGSDASAMPDYGIICKGRFEGEEIVGINLNWDKRYITLAPIATVLGLAFKLYDPDHLLAGQESLGITCALIPTHLPGIHIGRQHCPLNSAFPNGPTQGVNVFIPLDWIIGGVAMAGQGWRMIMECLAAGRAISLPSMATGGAKISAFATGAYARIRNQFHLPIGKFGGVEEALARIAGFTYIMEATRLFTVCALDRGEKPAVAAAISKYHVTELGRYVINDAMDIHGGKGICMGPKNYLAICYQETPISITVEGANILTRSMIIFGQGAIRCHPFILKEMEALKLEDQKQGLKIFDKAIFSHFGFTLSNAVRSFILGVTNSKWVKAPPGCFKPYYQNLTRLSAALAFVSDLLMMLLGSSLKRKEKLSARLGDVLSMLYLGSAVLKQFENNGQKEEEIGVVTWACQFLLFNAQKQLFDVLIHLPNRLMAGIIKFLVFPLGRRWRQPNDQLGQKVAKLMLNPNSLRATLAKDAYLDANKNNPVGYLEETLKKIIAAEELEQTIHEAVSQKKIQGYTFEQRVNEAITKKIITQAEAECVLEAYRARKEVLAVDDFAAITPHVQVEQHLIQG